MAKSVQLEHCKEKHVENASADGTDRFDSLEGEIDGDICTGKRTAYNI